MKLAAHIIILCLFGCSADTDCGSNTLGISECRVSGDCFHDRPENKTVNIPADLPQWCYSPDGSRCDWYSQCLEKRHPCEGQDAAYAVKYGQHFCNLYNENYKNFSSKGQLWVDAVRLCLQVKLVPFLCPFESSTCKEIKERAFQTHVPCYLDPNPGKPSICDLGVNDWFEVFRTIKGALALFKERSDYLRNDKTRRGQDRSQFSRWAANSIENNKANNSNRSNRAGNGTYQKATLIKPAGGSSAPRSGSARKNMSWNILLLQFDAACFKRFTL